MKPTEQHRQALIASQKRVLFESLTREFSEAQLSALSETFDAIAAERGAVRACKVIQEECGSSGKRLEAQAFANTMFVSEPLNYAGRQIYKQLDSIKDRKLPVKSHADKIKEASKRFVSRLQGLQAEYRGHLGRFDIVDNDDKRTVIAHYLNDAQAQSNEFEAYGAANGFKQIRELEFFD